MFWKIFIDSLLFILGILVVGWFIALLIGRRKPAQGKLDPRDPED